MVRPLAFRSARRGGIGDPRSILGSNLILSLNSDLGISSPGSTFQTWQDQSGRGNHAVQNTANARFTHVQNVIDGHACVRGTGVNDYMTGPLTGMSVGDRMTIWAVAAFPSAAADHTIIETTDATGGSNEGVVLYRNNRRPTVSMKVGTGGGGFGGHGGDCAMEDPAAIGLLRVTHTAGELIELYHNEMFRSAGVVGSHTGGLTKAQTQYSLGLLYAGVFYMYADLFGLHIGKNVSSQMQLDDMAAYFNATYPSTGLLSSGYIGLAGQSNAARIELGTSNPVMPGFLWDQRGIDGTAISYWTAGSPGFDNLIRSIKRFPATSKIIVPFVQGESDCSDALSPLYQTRLTNLRAAVATATGRSDIFWLIVKLSTSNTTSGSAGGRTTVRSAQTAVAAVGDAALIEIDDLTLEDGVHLNTAGQAELCNRIAASIETRYGL